MDAVPEVPDDPRPSHALATHGATLERPKLSAWGDVSSLLPDTFTLDDGRTRAFLSVVTFLDTNLFVRFAPFIRLRAHQTNYRA